VCGSQTLRLNDALDVLTVFDPCRATVVELRFPGA